MKHDYDFVSLALLAILIILVNIGSITAAPPPSIYGLMESDSFAPAFEVNKMQVRVVQLDSNDDFAICIGYGSTVTNEVQIRRYNYSRISGNLVGEDLHFLTSGSQYRDWSFADRSTPDCRSIALLDLNGDVVRGPQFTTEASAPAEKRGLIGTIRLGNTTNLLNFYANSSSAWVEDRSFTFNSSQSNILGSLSVSTFGPGSFIMALETTYLLTHPITPTVFEKTDSVGWTNVAVDFPAIAPSTTAWPQLTHYMCCYDNGEPIADDSKLHCRVRSANPQTIDYGFSANVTFSKVTVSAVNSDYAIVSALATSGPDSHFRLYAVNRANATKVGGSIWVGDAASLVTQDSKNNLIGMATISTLGKVEFKVLSFNAEGTPTASPTGSVPVVGPSSNPSPSPSSGPIPGPSSSPTEGPSQTPIPGAEKPVPPVGAGGVPSDVQIGVGVSLSVAGAAAGLLVLLLLLKKRKQKKKKTLGDKTPMTDMKDDESKYSNLPGSSAGKYGVLDAAGNGKYSNMGTAAPEDDGIAVPTNIQPSEIDKRMHIPYKSLVFVKEVGAGSYGKVYLGEWRGAKVAIKVSNTVTDVDGFLAEAKLTLGITPHPNLVQTFGVSLDGPNPCIVLEYCGGGSLDQLFTSDKGLSNEKRLEYALKIGYGLAHLHSRNIVHRDLAARNILLTNDGQPKISDFGMSRIVQEEAAKGRTKTNFGPIRWMAPENIRDKSYSLKSDVWSFGITLWELVTGKEPHEDEDQLEIALKIRDRGVTPAIPDACEPALKQCMEMCWKFSPADRPSMEEVCDFLRSKSPMD